MTNKSSIEDRKPRFAKWLAEPLLANKATYLKVAVAAAMINIFGLATAMFTMTVYDRVVPNNAIESLIALSIGLSVVIVFDFILRTLRAYFIDIAGARVDEDVGLAVFNRLLRIRLDHKEGSTGALAGLVKELETLRDFFASATMTAVVDVPFILLTLLVIALIGGPIALVPGIMIPVVLLTGYFSQPALDRISRQTMREGLHKQAVLVEAIGGLEMVKTSNAGEMLTSRWKKALQSHSQFSLRQRLVSSININVATSAQLISYAGIVIVGVGMIEARTLSLGGLIACSILNGRALAPLGQIAGLMSRITLTRTAYQQLNGMMEKPSEGEAETALHLAKINGHIEFRNVEFRYPGANENALSNVTFKIDAGEHVALLGRVGSGKSTVAKLILGLYPPAAGLVMVDGTDIRQLDPYRFRKLIGTAMQESVLISGSVRENIALGRENVPDEELIRASTLSGSHDFMGKIANGYDLNLADRGEGLSGGQRQSIALARALAGRPPIFVLDEPTSAMDAETEAKLLRRLGEEMVGRTLILITHRPPMLRLVSRIILLDKGRVIADGPRDEIVKKLQMPGKMKPQKTTGTDDQKSDTDGTSATVISRTT